VSLVVVMEGRAGAKRHGCGSVWASVAGLVGGVDEGGVIIRYLKYYILSASI